MKRSAWRATCPFPGPTATILRRPGSPPWDNAAVADDLNDNVNAFRALLGEAGQRLLAAVRDHRPEDELALATRLRREHPAELVAVALAQARLRQRARAKFGAADAERMYFTPDGVEQATRARVAAHRARRFAALGVGTLADLCCGIGGDAIALARAGIRVLAVDRSPLTCAVARANAEALGLAGRIEVRCADVTEPLGIAGYDAVFVDPGRRAERPGRKPRRIFDPEACSPPLSWAVRVARQAPCAALKVAPGIPHQAVPDGVEAEWVSDRGEVTEAALWFGDGCGGRRATLLPGGHWLAGPCHVSQVATLPAPETGPVGRYLYEPDGAVIRAHLIAEVADRVGGRLLDPSIAYLTSEKLTATEYATAYEITDTLPFNLKHLRALLREREVGTVTVKKRGSAVSPEELRRRLRLKSQGGNSCTIFLTRLSGAPTMLLGHPAATR